MIKQWKSSLMVSLMIICISTIGYYFFNYSSPANLNSDRIGFVTESSFPGLSALFLTKGVYVMNIDSPGLTRVIQQSGIELDLAWSPQGDKIAYYDYDSRNLYTVRADNSGQSEIIQKEIFVANLDWSPDGSSIAFSNGAGRVYILDLITGQIRPLLDDSTRGSEPSWSPDGTKIVFTLNPLSNGPKSSIAIINIDGSDLVQLTPNDNSRSPKWSPRHNQILFERERNIYIMDLDGTNVRVLIEDGKSYMPSWSPDGTRIAYVSAVNQECGITFADGPQFCTNELRVMNVDGSNVKVIRNRRNERYMSPIWAPHN